MTQPVLRRSWIIGLVAATTTALAPGVAYAEPSTNDDFDNATTITALPFQATENTVEATTAPDDPTSCTYLGGNSVWFRYTAPQNAIVRATAIATEYRPVLSVYTGVRGDLTLVPGACAFGSGNSETFHVAAGTTYHLLVVSDYGDVGGALTLELRSVAPSLNDDFANAERVTALPVTVAGDLARAGSEPGEQLPSCQDSATQSVWYSYRPSTTRWVTTSVGLFAVTVYRGDALTTLAEVDCVSGRPAVFLADAGETYHLRVAFHSSWANRFTMNIETAPPLTPWADIFPNPASVFDDVLLRPAPGDPLGRWTASGELRFGDGTSTPISASDTYFHHRYAVDGMYEVGINVVTSDGRTGTGTQTVRVETHDVTVTEFSAPVSARVDQTKPITVTVANTRYDETVAVELFRQTADSLTRIGSLTQWVPARPDRTVKFPFAYTFSAADAATGSVIFKAIARVPFPLQDAHPVDNEKTATTAVR